MPSEDTTSNNQSADDQIRIMMEKCAATTDAINCTAQKLIMIPLQYKKGVQAWLKAVNLKIKHQKTKLAPKQYRLFTVERKISLVAYQLWLPTS
jgi:hypothetical protein